MALPRASGLGRKVFSQGVEAKADGANSGVPAAGFDMTKPQAIESLSDRRGRVGS